MRVNLARDIEQQGSRARERRVYTSGRVVAIFPGSHTCRLDVAHSDQLGATVYMEGLPYTQQTPPNVGDTVAISYTPSGAPYVGNAKLSSGNTTINLVGGVTSVSKSGSTKLQNDVTLSAGTNVTLTQSGQNIAIASTAGGMAIGGAISGGTASRILFEDAGVVLADDASLTYDKTNKTVTIKAADVSVNPAIVAGEANTAATATSYATIRCERISTGTPGAGWGVGIGFSWGVSSGASVQRGAFTAEWESATRGKFCWRTHYDGDNNIDMTLSARGDLSFQPKAGSGAFGLTLCNVASSAVTAPVRGALVDDGGVAKHYTGTAWESLSGKMLEVCILTSGIATVGVSVPVALQELLGLTHLRGNADLTNYTQARIVLVTQTNSQVFAGAPTFAVQWCATNTGTFAYLDGASGPSLANPFSKAQVGAWVNLSSGAMSDCILRVVTSNVGGPDTVNVGRLVIQFR